MPYPILPALKLCILTLHDDEKERSEKQNYDN